MKAISKKPSIIILFGILWLLLMAIMRMYYVPQFEAVTGQQLLDIGAYAAKDLNALVSSFSSEGIEIYNKIQFLDFIAPILFGLCLSALCFRLLFLVTGKKYLLGYFPLLATVSDLSENSIIAHILYTYPSAVSADLAQTLLVCTTLKFLFYISSILLSISLSLFWLIKKKIKIISVFISTLILTSFVPASL